MNKEYTYIDGKVIVRDEKGKQKVVEYYDNLDDVLKQENLLENIQKRIIQLKIEKEKLGANKKYKPFYCLLTALAGVFICLSLITVLCHYNILITFDMVLMKNLCLGASGIMVLTGVLFDTVGHIFNKRVKKRKKVVNDELDILEKIEDAEKEKLEKLKNDKVKENEPTEFKTTKLNDIESLNNLKSRLQLYYKINDNLKKYYDYLQQGKLDQELSNCYNETDIEIAKKIIEEKGPTLVKKEKVIF